LSPAPVAISALDAADGEQLLVAEDAEQGAAAILRLLADAPLRNRLSSAGRRYVEQHHDWDAVAGRLETIYEAVRREA